MIVVCTNYKLRKHYWSNTFILRKLIMDAKIKNSIIIRISLRSFFDYSKKIMKNIYTLEFLVH